MTDEEAKAEALRRLSACRSDDTEADHCYADGVLVWFLRQIGHDDVADAWEEVDKWYA